VRLPLALADVHWETEPGDVVDVELPDHERVADIVVGAGFERVRSGLRRVRTLPDTVGPGMRVLVCGLNPSLVAADAGFGFAGPTNRFWRAATEAALVSHPRDPRHALKTDGVGMTDLVKRATPGTKELDGAEYVAGAQRVERLVRWLRPGVVLFVGLEGWRAAVDRRAEPGPQANGFAGVPAYVMPSTSGLNAHSRLADLAEHMRTALTGQR
jgi:TDG/mug DNA glycosylase family protein